MNLYDKSSLILIPGAVKDGKVYSQRPENGDGDFTFTRGSAATRVNENGLIESVGSNEPRLDYSGGASCPSLLLEPQRTNLIPYSEALENYSGGYGGSQIFNTTDLTPEGSNNARVLAYYGGTNQHYFSYTPSVTNGETYTFSAFLKKKELRYVALIFLNDFSGQFFDLENGTILGTISGGPTNSTIEDYGNGWYRCSITDTATSTTKFSGVYLSENGTSYGGITPTNTDGVYVYGIQIEQGSYPSSYIPTYGSAVTRSADVCNSLTQAGNDGIINDYNTSVFIDLAEVISNMAVIRFVTLFSASGGSNPRVLLYANGPGSQIILQYRVTGQTDLIISSSYISANQNKVLFRLNDNKLALFHNGSKVSEITIVKGNDIEYLTLAESSASDSGYRLSNLLSFPTALTDSECIALTTL